ncbi:rhodanese-like domain-containing protein [Marisediminicola senii]|uniref:rhodanese-like domain-containing protein n=1 Tax=Marisediminicola senii TaxID=2711233 RepID=UPI0013ECFECA|nr:rhodanese-like domain-containing protein [Marisediminicola senii]
MAANEITATEAIALMTGDRAVLLDVREPDEWDRGHSVVATSVPMSQLQERIAEVPDDRPLLVVCHSGHRSAMVSSALVDAGYDATNVIGGMVAWKAAGGQLVAVGAAEPTVD